MNWFRVKIILILLFAGVNIFLVCNSFISKSREASISRETVVDVVEILARKGIRIRGDKIAMRVERMKSIDSMSIENLKSNFIQKKLKEGWQKLDEQNYQKEGKHFSFIDGKIEYFDDQSRKEVFDINEVNAERIAKKELTKLHFDMDKAKVKKVTPIDDGFFIEYIQTYNDYEVFASFLDVCVNDGGVYKVQGCWNELNVGTGGYIDIKHSVNALMDYMNDPNCSLNIEITDVTIGYVISQMDIDQSLMLMPAIPYWRITTSANEVFYYDARSSGS